MSRLRRRTPHRLAVVGALLVAGCSGDAGATADPRGGQPTVPASTVAPVPPRSIVDEVEAAYRRSWAVYAEAVGRVDPSRLALAFGASALLLRRREVDALRRSGEAVRVAVTHDLEVALVDTETAVVTDVLENHMVRVDPDTGRALEPDPDDILTRAYTLRREGGTWKVTEAVALG